MLYSSMRYSGVLYSGMSKFLVKPILIDAGIKQVRWGVESPNADTSLLSRIHKSQIRGRQGEGNSVELIQ